MLHRQDDRHRIVDTRVAVDDDLSGLGGSFAQRDMKRDRQGHPVFRVQCRWPSARRAKKWRWDQETRDPEGMENDIDRMTVTLGVFHDALLGRTRHGVG
jgi:hypothetical protein